MSIELKLQIATDSRIPNFLQLNRWINLTLLGRLDTAELTIRIVDEVESASLNKQYCHKDGATNVLSFPTDMHEEFNFLLLGDIVICAPIIEKEAQTHHQEPLAHWAHIIIHGTLHLLGYKHQTNDEADVMERLETEILVKLGYPPPYGGEIIYE